MTTAYNLRPDAFQGTAEAYLRYRPPYPKAMLADLMGQVGGRGVLVDLACGPGRVALDLAHAFEAVIAIDLEPEMVAAGRAEAERRGIVNVSWAIGRAEEAEIAPGSVDLITIGEAIHRLDHERIAVKALDWLKPGGTLATMGTEAILGGGEPWKEAATEIAFRWAAQLPGGWAASRQGAALTAADIEQGLRAAGFTHVGTREFDEPRSWSFDEVAGYLRSTSICAEKRLGDHWPAFEADLKAALGEPEGAVFHERLRAGCTVARKPLRAPAPRA